VTRLLDGRHHLERFAMEQAGEVDCPEHLEGQRVRRHQPAVRRSPGPRTRRGTFASRDLHRSKVGGGRRWDLTVRRRSGPPLPADACSNVHPRRWQRLGRFRPSRPSVTATSCPTPHWAYDRGDRDAHGTRSSARARLNALSVW